LSVQGRDIFWPRLPAPGAGASGQRARDYRSSEPRDRAQDEKRVDAMEEFTEEVLSDDTYEVVEVVTPESRRL
jgi:hypothetical protein